MFLRNPSAFSHVHLLSNIDRKLRLTMHQTELQIASFKHFRDGQTRFSIAQQQHDTISRDDDAIELQKTLENLHNSDDLNNLLELRDIEDELGTLKKLFEEQKTVIHQMIAAYDQLDVSKQFQLEESKQLEKSIQREVSKQFELSRQSETPKQLELSKQHEVSEQLKTSKQSMEKSLDCLKAALTHCEDYLRQVKSMRDACTSAEESVSFM